MALPRSPSVVVIENDQSVYTPNVESSVVGIVGFADKGPPNLPTLVTSQENLLRIFGRPDSNIPGQGLEGALEILEATNQIYFVRAINSDTAAYASAVFPLGACPSVYIDTSNVGFTSTTSSIYIQVKDNTGIIQFTETLSVASSTSVTSLNNYFLNYFNPEAIGDQVCVAYKDPDFDGIFLASRYAGSGASLHISGGPTFSSTFVPINSTTGDPEDPLVVLPSSSVTSWGATSKNGNLTLYSVYQGAGYNLSSLRDGSIVGLSVEIDNISTRDRVIVNSEGTTKENFLIELSPSSLYSIENLLVNHPTNNKSDYIFANITSGTSTQALASIIPDQYGENAVSLTYQQGDGSTGTATTATLRFVKPVENNLPFVNGRSGYSTTEVGTNADITALIGTATAKSGIYALDDDYLNISLALVPGIVNDSLQNALITLAESTKNFLALVSPPMGYEFAQDAINWINGKDTAYRSAALNSSWAAVAWPWVQVFNVFAGADEWYDPAIFVARQCVYTDNVAEPWFAPAGYRRGRLTKPSNVEVYLNQGDKDALYSNSINPITREQQTGITIFGQRTTQRLPTALDRINVRRLMIYIRKVLIQLGKPFQFEPNDQFTWELVEEALRPFIDDLLARRAIVQGDVKCDASTNTPLRVDRNELWCSVTIKPTKAAETIVFEVNLTNQSASISG